MSSFFIRIAAPGDADAVREIYRWYVENTAVTYDYETPSEEEFSRRIARTLEFYPWLIAESDGSVAGFAYAGRFHPRAAYDRCAELSIYLAPHNRRLGLGRALYTALEEALKLMGILNLYACIASPPEPDEYLTDGSERFHERMGFHRNGLFRSCGYKFGRWYDMIWMEKLIGEHTADEPPIQPFSSAVPDTAPFFFQFPRS